MRFLALPQSGPSSPLALGLWLGAFAAFLACTPSSQVDLGFHLATGRAILELGGIPATNVLSFAEPDHPWLLQQGWPTVAMEGLWRWGGVAAIVATRMVVVGLTFGILAWGVFRLRDATAPALAALVLGVVAAGFRFVDRPLILTNLLLAIVVVALLSWWWQRRPRMAATVVGAAVLVGAQVHAGVIYLVLVAGAFGAGALIAGRVPAYREQTDMPTPSPRQVLELAVATGLGLVLGAVLLQLYHPMGAGVLLVPLQLGGDPWLHAMVLEYRPLWRFPVGSLWPVWLLLVALLPALLAWRRIPLGLTLATLGLAYLALRHVRNVDSLAVVASVFLVMAVPVGERLRATEFRRAMPPFVLVALIALGGAAHQFSQQGWGIRLPEEVWPKALFAEVERGPWKGPAYVSNAWAGSWLGAFYPTERVFFDTRFEAYSEAFVRDVYMHIRDGKQGWDAQLDAYGVELLVLRYTTPGERARQGGAPNVRQAAVDHPRWTLVAFDDHGMMLARAQGTNQDLARASAIPGVEPDSFAYHPHPATAQALRTARERLAPSARLDALLVMVLTDVGAIGEAVDLIEASVALHGLTHPALQRAHQHLEAALLEHMP